METNFIKNFDDLMHLVNDNGKNLASSEILHRFSDYVDSLTMKGLERLIYEIYNKWPHSRYKINLQNAIKRHVQTKFYKELYHNEPPESVIKRNEACTSTLLLKDEACVFEQPEHLKEFKPPVHKKHKPGTSDLSIKISDMSLDELIKWAIDIDVPLEKIDKHRSKPVGLAKMNIGNIVKAHLRKKGETVC